MKNIIDIDTKFEENRHRRPNNESATSPIHCKKNPFVSQTIQSVLPDGWKMEGKKNYLKMLLTLMNFWISE
jgi:hypothetical protein